VARAGIAPEQVAASPARAAAASEQVESRAESSLEQAGTAVERVAEQAGDAPGERAPAQAEAAAEGLGSDESVGSIPMVRRVPELPDDIEYSDLDPEARRELRGLTKTVAELVGRHLVAAGRLIDDDPELALAHARYARSRASRVALVREAAGLTAYHAGEWAEALAELRAARRMTGGQAHLPVMADCERALGRPERALELAAEARDLPKDVAVELSIVAAGARRDMGQLDAAVVALQGPDLDPRVHEAWSPRLFYAYADNLEAAGRTDDAIRWFLNAAEADLDEETDAAERAFALRGPE
jgi:tetratricopeptide (TPR) repeat protein